MILQRDSASLQTFFNNAPQISFQKKQILLSPQDHTGFFYYLETGTVRSYTITEWGEEKLGAIYRPNEIFPLLFIFDRKPLTRYYEAMEPVTVRKCRVDDFVVYVQQSQGALVELARKAADVLEIFSDRIEVLEYTKAHARVIAFLLHCVKRFGIKRTGNSYLIDVPISHKDIASGVATARETVTRELLKLEKKDLITHERNLVLVRDLPRLEEELALFHQRKLL
jgi:CRP-like cAMP-binding protein